MTLFEEPRPEGFLYTPMWISNAQESTLVDLVDQGPWRQDLGRRTQHFGWRYNYSSGRVEHDVSTPKIPSHLIEIGERLKSELSLPKAPDQVIVNEYIVRDGVAQGISSHRDHIRDFGPIVVTLSLLENWTMRFTRPGFNTVDVLLEARSIGVMTGESRYEWNHAIPSRKYDGVGQMRRRRSRRLSITFRVVEK